MTNATGCVDFHFDFQRNNHLYYFTLVTIYQIRTDQSRCVDLKKFFFFANVADEKLAGKSAAW